MLHLKTVKPLRKRVVRWDEYPSDIPPIASLTFLEMTSRICFFVGENGTVKANTIGGHCCPLRFRARRWEPKYISRSRPLQVCAPFDSLIRTIGFTNRT